MGSKPSQKVSPEGFWRHATRGEPDQCWLWRGYIEWNGYGKLAAQWAHRISYRMLVGPIPKGLQLDHLCRNRACVNPKHLEPVTRQENIARGEMHLVGPRLAAKRTHCKQGHPYDEANTYWYQGHRQCRTCKRDYDRKHKSLALNGTKRRTA